MSTYANTATFNLKVVVSETGLKPDTVRAWERRYGLPAPDRTAGGHRLYSERDIATLKWLVARKDEGMSISKAVGLWRQLERDSRDPLVEMPLLEDRLEAESAMLRPGSTLEEAREAWIKACLAYREVEADQILAEAFAEFPVETVCVSVLQQGLSAIGDRWYANQVSVQQEHFASELATRRLEALIAAAPRPHLTGSVLVGCAPDEDHVFAPLLLVLFLKRRGYQVVYLGANVPLDHLEATVAEVEPRIAVLTAQHLHSAARLQDVGFFLERAGVRLAYGGLIFNRIPELRSRIPGEFLGERLDQAATRLESLLKTRPQLPRVPDRAPELQAALDHFHDHQADIDGRVRDRLKQSPISHTDLETANHFLGQGISAALALGDAAYMGDNLEWVQGLLAYHGANHGALGYYLAAYREAAHEQLDQRAAPILSWLDQLPAAQFDS